MLEEIDIRTKDELVKELAGDTDISKEEMLDDPLSFSEYYERFN